MTPVISLALPILFCAALELDVSLSPDQPLPYGYIDDPVVVSVQSAADAQVEMNLTAEVPGAPEVALGTAPLMLRAGAPGLAAFMGFPPIRGTFKGTLNLRAGGEETAREVALARIERPGAATSLPVYIHSIETVEQVIAARAAGALGVRIDVGQPNLAALLRAASPMPVVLSVNSEQGPDLAKVIAGLPVDLAATVVRWAVDPAGNLATLQEISDTIRSTPFKAPLTLAVPDAATFERLLGEGAGKFVQAALLVSDVTTGKEARLMLDAAERAGYESWPLHVVSTGAADKAQVAIQQVIANMGVGAASTSLYAGLLYDGSAMGGAFVPLNALGRRLVATQHTGNLSLGTSVSAPLFRDGARWLLAVWSEGVAKEVEIPVGDAAELSMTDPYGNPVALAPVEKGVLKVTAGAFPALLSGTGGPLIGQASRAKAQATARRLLEDKVVQRWFGPELRALVQAVLDRQGELDRTSVITLMRALPEFEKQWHAGKLPRAAAVPAIADLSRLCRLLSAVDEDKGQAYLEPMHDMIARSEELQSIYLTGSGGGNAHERGDWILREVRRLIDEAKELSDSDRRIEAASVAALAEWRARGLEFAAQEGEKSALSEYEILAQTPGAALPAPATETASAPAAPEPAPMPVVKKDEPRKEDPKAAAPVEKADEKLEIGQPKGTRKVVHVVKKGDTPESIARQYGMDYELFRRTNGLKRGAVIRVGKEYVVYAPVKAGAAATKSEVPEKPAPPADAGQPAGTKKVIHTVVKGENPSVIASKYGVKTSDFLKWNNLTARARFQIGDEYVVYVPVKR